MPRTASGIHRSVSPHERSRTIAAARSILDQGGWCVLEVCVDVPHQLWESRVLIFDLVPNAVADVVDEEVGHEPQLDARLTGCNRCTLQPDEGLGAFPCYLAEHPRGPAEPTPAEPRLRE